MADETFEPDVLRVFGGMCTVVTRGQLGKGMSPDCSDVEFFPAVVQSRPGYALRVTDNSGFQSVATFVDNNGQRYTLMLEADGDLYYDDFFAGLTGAVLSPISTKIGTNLYMKGRNAFGRYIGGMSDGKRPVDFPFSWNPTTGYRGLSTSPPTRGPVAATSANNSTAAGGVTLGLHYFAISFEDDLGYETRLGPESTFSVVNGAKKVALTFVQLGPPGTVRRRIWATAKDQGDFYSLGATAGFVIEDNTTTTADLDFNDTDLVSNGVPYAPAMTLAEPRMAAGVSQYGNRLALYGVYAEFEPRIIKTQLTPLVAQPTLLGPYDEDFETEDPGGSPSIWTPSGSGGGGTGLYPPLTGPPPPNLSLGPDPHDGTRSRYFRIYGGAPGGPVEYKYIFIQGRTSQLQDTQRFLPVGTKVGILVRLKRSQGATTGGFHIKVKGMQTSLSYIDRVVPSSALSTTWKTFVVSGFEQIVINPPLGIDPKDLTLELTIQATGNVTIPSTDPVPPGEYVAIDFFRFVDSRFPFDADRVWFSSSIQQPAEFDLVASPLEVAIGNGEAITGAFEQSGNYYILKQRSWWVTSDNMNDPSAWELDNVSPIVGSPGFYAWDSGPDFAIVCDLSGVYKFTGGAPEKISDEIENRWQGDLDTANAHLMWCSIDPNKKIVRIGVPVKNGGFGPCHQIWTLNYVEGWDSGVANGGVGRKWSIDRVQSTGGAIIQLDALQRRFNLFGKRQSSNWINQPVGIYTKPPWQDVGSLSPATFGSGGTPDPFAANGACSVNWPGGNPTQLRIQGNLVFAGGYFTVAFWMKAPFVGQQATLLTDLPGCASQTFTVTTTNWARYVFHFGPATADGGRAALWFDLGSSAGGFVLFGVQIQDGPYDRGFYNPQLGGNTGDSGYVSLPGEGPDYIPKLTDDWDNVFAPSYTTWAFQSDIGRSLYDKVVFRLEGGGNLLANWIRPDNVTQSLPGATSPNQVRLVSPARYDIELGDNLEDIHAAVQLLTFESGAWWSLSRLAVLLKSAPYSTFRR